MEIANRTLVKNYHLHEMTSATTWLATTTAVVILAGGLATASYYWLEAPVIDWARRIEPRLRPAPTR